MKNCLLLTFLGIVVFAPTLSVHADISPEEAARAAGQYVTVAGKVDSARRSNSGALYLNFGAPYPNQTFTISVLKGYAVNFPAAETYVGKMVKATGAISLRSDKPEMQVKSPEEIVIVNDAGSPATSTSTTETPTPAPTK